MSKIDEKPSDRMPPDKKPSVGKPPGNTPSKDKTSLGNLGHFLVGLAAVLTIIGAILNGLWSALWTYPRTVPSTGCGPPQNATILDAKENLQNVSFEDGLRPWNNARTTRAVVVDDSSEVHSKGKCYLAAHNAGKKESSPSIFQDIGYVAAPSRLTFSIWVKSRGYT